MRFDLVKKDNVDLQTTNSWCSLQCAVQPHDGAEKQQLLCVQRETRSSSRGATRWAAVPLTLRPRPYYSCYQKSTPRPPQQDNAARFSFMLQLQASASGFRPPACWKVPFPLCVVLEWPLTEHVGVVHLQRGNDGERQAAASVTVCPGLRGHQTLNRALGGMSCVLLLFFSSSTSCCASYLHWMFYLTCIIHSVWMFDLHCA